MLPPIVHIRTQNLAARVVVARMTDIRADRHLVQGSFVGAPGNPTRDPHPVAVRRVCPNFLN